jgi:hypothetical protein
MTPCVKTHLVWIVRRAETIATRISLERLDEVQRTWLTLALMRVVPGDQRLELL